MDLPKLLNCFGYAGFGSGYALALYGPADDTDLLACHRCAINDKCWDRHRDRVREMFPDLTAEVDAIAASGLKGDAYMKAVQALNEEMSDILVEPYIAVMAGNLKDGAQVATNSPLTDRGSSTLTWPLKVLTP